MKRVVVYLDGVLADMVTSLAARLMRQGCSYDEAVTTILYSQEQVQEQVNHWSFWKYVPPRLDALRAFPILAGRVDVVVSSHYLQEKHLITRWCDRYGIAARVSLQPQGDYWIDHHPLEIARYRNRGWNFAVIDYPYNRHLDDVNRFQAFHDAVASCFDTILP